jgi:pseudouridine-5'-phosphate glycosidase
MRDLLLHPDARAALEAGRPVVALESTVIAHGLPWPENFTLARDLEATVRAGGAVPATIAVLGGRARVGLTGAELEQVARSPGMAKLSRRDLAAAIAQGQDGATTVAGTMVIAHAAGIRVMATGGIGGVHRGTHADISADLPELARTPMVVVCSGAKAILDLPATLEWLETHGVPVIGFGTDEFPAFYSRSSGLGLDTKVETAKEVAAIARAAWDNGLGGGILVCVPCPEPAALPRAEVEAAVEQALSDSVEQGVMGKRVTPFLLARVADLTGGRSRAANLALLHRNAEVAAAVAVVRWQSGRG